MKTLSSTRAKKFGRRGARRRWSQTRPAQPSQPAVNQRETIREAIAAIDRQCPYLQGVVIE